MRSPPSCHHQRSQALSHLTLNLPTTSHHGHPNPKLTMPAPSVMPHALLGSAAAVALTVTRSGLPPPRLHHLQVQDQEAVLQDHLRLLALLLKIQASLLHPHPLLHDPTRPDQALSHPHLPHHDLQQRHLLRPPQELSDHLQKEDHHHAQLLKCEWTRNQLCHPHPRPLDQPLHATWALFHHLLPPPEALLLEWQNLWMLAQCAISAALQSPLDSVSRVETIPKEARLFPHHPRPPRLLKHLLRHPLQGHAPSALHP
mmetsp:Transcript_16661/g.23131  ORF Transcript_16661/g.23131 Transcript_16661/m.23131 type:complete len:257 (-) Transcript_16661:676-1446(-)